MPPTGAIGHTTHTVSSRSRRPDVGRSNGCTRPAGCELHYWAWPTRAVMGMLQMSADLALTVPVKPTTEMQLYQHGSCSTVLFQNPHLAQGGGGGAAAAAAALRRCRQPSPM